jgi:hypothetical protein
MRLRTVQETYEPGQTFTLYPLGDVHLGSANCDKGAFFKLVDTIRADPTARWIGMGDYCEWITVQDPRWSGGGIDKAIIADPEELDLLGDRYVTKLATVLRPIMDKCWAMGEGNHETAFQKRHPFNLVKLVLKECGADPELYTGWASITKVRFADKNSHRTAISIYHSHGWQAGRLSGAKVNQLDHMGGWIDGCRLYLQGHSHDNVVKMKAKLEASSDHHKLRAFNSFGAHTSSFLRTYQQGTAAYGEQKGYPPVPIGGIWFQMHPQREGVKMRAIQGDLW